MKKSLMMRASLNIQYQHGLQVCLMFYINLNVVGQTYMDIFIAGNVRQAQLAMQQHIPMKLVLKFFDAKSCTPDLKDLFQGIDPKKLKRSSSAIWKTPPRFSMMNKSIIED